LICAIAQITALWHNAKQICMIAHIFGKAYEFGYNLRDRAYEF
jgi:hypothetical protein